MDLNSYRNKNMGSNLRIISGSFDRVLKLGGTCEHPRESIWHIDSFYICLFRPHKENISQVKGSPPQVSQLKQAFL